MELVHPEIRQDNEGRLICEICDDSFLHLGTHVWSKHGVRADEYRDAQGLPHSAGLVAISVKQKLSDHAFDRMEQDPGGFAEAMEKGRADEAKAKAAATYSRRVGGGILDLGRGGIESFTCVICGVVFDGIRSNNPKHCPEHVAEYQRQAGWRLHNRDQQRMRDDPTYRKRRLVGFQEALKPWHEKQALIHRTRMLAAGDLYGVGFLVSEVAEILKVSSHAVTRMLHEAGLGDLRGKDSNRSRRRRGELKAP